MALVIEIAEAVRQELIAASFSQPLAAVRRYVPVYELADMDLLHVTVVPKDTELELADRSGLIEQDCRLDIGIQQRVDPDKLEQVDALMGLVEEVADHFSGWRLETPPARCVHIENRPLYDPVHLDQLRQLTSVLTLTFRATRRPS